MRLVSLVALLFALSGTGNGELTQPAQSTYVVLETSVGSIELELYADKAPASVQAFLTYVDNGSFATHGTFYRVVRGSENDRGHPPIKVIQGGWKDAPKTLPRIRHEATRETGLRHLSGTVSLARGVLGSTTGVAFFICVSDQPALDFGGGRDPFGDGQGFAAFGRVVKGMDVVRRIYGLHLSDTASDPYNRGQMLATPVRILRAYRILETDLKLERSLQ